jgi:hypothetical protein
LFGIHGVLGLRLSFASKGQISTKVGDFAFFETKNFKKNHGAGARVFSRLSKNGFQLRILNAPLSGSCRCCEKASVLPLPAR